MKTKVIYIFVYFSDATLDDPSDDIYEELVGNFSHTPIPTDISFNSTVEQEDNQ
jgi:hypothetical protein